MSCQAAGKKAEYASSLWSMYGQSLLCLWKLEDGKPEMCQHAHKLAHVCMHCVHVFTVVDVYECQATVVGYEMVTIGYANTHIS